MCLYPDQLFEVDFIGIINQVFWRLSVLVQRLEIQLEIGLLCDGLADSRIVGLRVNTFSLLSFVHFVGNR